MIDETIKIDGKTQLEMGVVFEENNFTAKAELTFISTEISGKNGNDYTPLNYKDVRRELSIQLIDLTKESAVYAWLNGNRSLEYKNKITTIHFYESFSLDRDGGIRTGKVNFIRHPFWYKKEDPFLEIEAEIVNEGTVFSEPLIRLEKTESNSVDLTIGSVRFSYSFEEDSYVEINSETGDVLYEGLNRDPQINIGFLYPTLQIGENPVIIHSGDAVIKVKKKDRWL